MTARAGSGSAPPASASGARQASPARVGLRLTLPPSELSRFGALLQRGVAVRATAGRSAHAFLTEQLGLAPGYVEERITTVFLDGQVVDVLEEAVLRDGSLLALSAAMPGLVGATLRKGGYYSAMRAAITRAADRPPRAAGVEETIVRVKLFNLLIDELGPVVLAHGVVLGRREALEVLGQSSGAASGSPDDAGVELRVEFA